ncbi:pentatricopeptide repeat-containing protein [Tripterygium wilfordii]|uniref:Pentatricopeptide repeat-containing protein n=1 Tax=Tripterygium wilfordii TaxID=458696 RepID=A0A7J7CTD0_TRIWF|nr:pentatricopeptide repeat-containing protein At3g21470 [Tripterygium wilfordii]KAF5737340.1 pentatricopeptide repeat-containing protein [Tripterygium wilfordii]
MNWHGIMRSYISRNLPAEALATYSRIRHDGLYIFGLVPLVFKACASLSVVNTGRALHAESVKFGADFDVVAATSMLDMYAKCGDIVASRQVFDSMPKRNVVSWNAMIGGYVCNGDMKSASILFEQMPERTVVTWNEMVYGLAINGDIVNARCMFDCVPTDLKNVVTWTVMIDGHATKGEMEAARELFEKMPEKNFFVWSSMISGYCKRGEVEQARVIFDRIPTRNLVIWNSLICGYTQNGFCEAALEAFGRMQAEGFEPDEVTVASLLSACAHLGDLDNGTKIHQMIHYKRLKLNEFVLTALIDMYAKCGDLTSARSLFEGMKDRNTASWNSMITGSASHGESEEALEFFRRMEDSNVKPDELTFLSVLSACVHGGLVDEGLKIFHKMKSYAIVAGIKHYGCSVDLLGRAGRLEEAYALIKTMPIEPNHAVWGTLLGACQIHLGTEMVRRVMKEVGADGSRSSGSCESHHVLLSNIYAASARWEKAERMRMTMSNKGVRKIPGSSSLISPTF